MTGLEAQRPGQPPQDTDSDRSASGPERGESRTTAARLAGGKVVDAVLSGRGIEHRSHVSREAARRIIDNLVELVDELTERAANRPSGFHDEAFDL